VLPIGGGGGGGAPVLAGPTPMFPPQCAQKRP
jgi:hypothetical protein